MAKPSRLHHARRVAYRGLSDLIRTAGGWFSIFVALSPLAQPFYSVAVRPSHSVTLEEVLPSIVIVILLLIGALVVQLVAAPYRLEKDAHMGTRQRLGRFRSIAAERQKEIDRLQDTLDVFRRVGRLEEAEDSTTGDIQGNWESTPIDIEPEEPLSQAHFIMSATDSNLQCSCGWQGRLRDFESHTRGLGTISLWKAPHRVEDS